MTMLPALFVFVVCIALFIGGVQTNRPMIALAAIAAFVIIGVPSCTVGVATLPSDSPSEYDYEDPDDHGFVGCDGPNDPSRDWMYEDCDD